MALLETMAAEGIEPDEVTYTSVLKARDEPRSADHSRD